MDCCYQYPGNHLHRRLEATRHGSQLYDYLSHSLICLLSLAMTMHRRYWLRVLVWPLSYHCSPQRNQRLHRLDGDLNGSIVSDCRILNLSPSDGLESLTMAGTGCKSFRRVELAIKSRFVKASLKQCYSYFVSNVKHMHQCTNCYLR